MDRLTLPVWNFLTTERQTPSTENSCHMIKLGLSLKRSKRGQNPSLCNRTLFSVAAAFHWTQRPPVWEDNDAQTHPVQAGRDGRLTSKPSRTGKALAFSRRTKTTKTRPAAPEHHKITISAGAHTKGDQLPQDNISVSDSVIFSTLVI